MSEQKYIDFFQEVNKFKTEQQKQKQRGLNDYNMVNVVRSETAEVGMHSNIIYSLINPNGLHYQDELFLNIFIEKVLEFSIEDFGTVLSVEAEESTSENRRIDFTIKSSNYYIGIEMKINADDLKEQISHYFSDLTYKAQNDSEQEVIIYYLTLDEKEASKDSHNNVPYKKISFSENILNWIIFCQEEVNNITNLNEAFENYKDIVKKITDKNYKGKTKTMEELIFKSEENLAIVNDIYNDYENIRLNIVKEFFSVDLIKYFENKFEELEKYKDWIIEIDDDILKPNFYAPIRIKKTNWILVFKFSFDSRNLDYGYYGISLEKDSISLKTFKNEIDKYNKLDRWKKNTSVSIFWDYTPRSNSYKSENIVDFKFNKNRVCQEYFELFEKTIKQLENYGTTLDELNNDYNKYIIETKEKNHDPI